MRALIIVLLLLSSAGGALAKGASVCPSTGTVGVCVQDEYRVPEGRCTQGGASEMGRTAVGAAVDDAAASVEGRQWCANSGGTTARGSGLFVNARYDDIALRVAWYEEERTSDAGAEKTCATTVTILDSTRDRGCPAGPPPRLDWGRFSGG